MLILNTKKMNNYILIILLLFAFSCSTQKESGGEGTSCNTEATVKDFTGLDGCSFLIVLDNGDKLLPAKVTGGGFNFRDGQRIKFGYREMPDQVSICMAEKMTVEVTCIEEISSGGGRPAIPECYDTANPMRLDWMKAIIKEKAIFSVKKYKYRTDGWAYLFSTRMKHYLYDCQGTELCNYSGTASDDCLGKYVPGELGKVIWSNQQ